MLGGIVKCDRAIEMGSPFLEGTAMQYGPHDAVPDHDRNRRPSLFGERQELARPPAQSIAVERNKARSPETV